MQNSKLPPLQPGTQLLQAPISSSELDMRGGRQKIVTLFFLFSGFQRKTRRCGGRRILAENRFISICTHQFRKNVEYCTVTLMSL